MSSSTHNAVAFRKFGIITIIAVYVLIMVGGIVRSTGAGMGCPDWPKCFGTWVPPTDIRQLPPDYKTRFAVQGRTIADFDTFKTWTEYVNRLVGVLIGLFIFITLLLSIRFLKSDPIIFYFSLLAFVLVAFEGWLGAKVVASNLSPGIITIHMVGALAVVAVLIYAVARSFHRVISFGEIKNKSFINTLLIVCTVISFSQIVIGTQLREAIDVIAELMQGAGRETWLEQIGMKFYVHRSFSIGVLLLHFYLLYVVQKNVVVAGKIGFWSKVLIGVLVGEVASGVIMAYFAIPAIMQPVHLLLGALVFGIQFLLLLMLNYDKVFQASPREAVRPQLHKV